MTRSPAWTQSLHQQRTCRLNGQHAAGQRGGYILNDSNGGNNYSVTTNTAAGTITKASLTVSTSAINRVYDGTTNATRTPVATVGTLFSGDTLVGRHLLPL